MNKKIFLAFVFLICIASVMAQPPFQQTTGSGFLEIIYPQISLYRLNEDIGFNFQVANSSGHILNSSAGEVDCLIEVQNSSSDVIQLTAASKQNFYFNPTIETGYLGRFGYIVSCNASNGEQGFVSSYYDVTFTGIEEQQEGRTIIAMIILIPLVLGLFMLIGAATLGQSHALLRIFLFLLSPAFFYTSLHYGILAAVKFYNFPELQDGTSTTILWVGVVWAVLIIYFIIYAIVKMVQQAAQEKEKEMEY